MTSRMGHCWRTDQDGISPSARFISFPYDLDAHLTKKGTIAYVGYKAHLIDVCDEAAWDHLVLYSSMAQYIISTVDGRLCMVCISILRSVPGLRLRNAAGAVFLTRNEEWSTR
jgi:hypothetical protein